eukprot:7595884-Lingulodinium_polyedra.AAC.1
MTGPSAGGGGSGGCLGQRAVRGGFQASLLQGVGPRRSAGPRLGSSRRRIIAVPVLASVS